MATISETAGNTGMTMDAPQAQTPQMTQTPPPASAQHSAPHQAHLEQQAHNHPDEAQFAALVRARWSVSLTLTALMLAIYFGFIMVLAFRRDLLQASAGGGMTLGIPVGFGIILIASALTGVYVWWANRAYDSAVRRIVTGMQSGMQSGEKAGQTMKGAHHG
ncbi:MAG TPA: DUF485 domain-containing protein [Nitratidesulfovibrio sp.]|nr:DUF485 domain-containing protein [Nitratidesulfovibrio sp.]